MLQATWSLPTGLLDFTQAGVLYSELGVGRLGLGVKDKKREVILESNPMYYPRGAA